MFIKIILLYEIQYKINRNFCVMCGDKRNVPTICVKLFIDIPLLNTTYIYFVYNGK